MTQSFQGMSLLNADLIVSGNHKEHRHGKITNILSNMYLYILAYVCIYTHIYICIHAQIYVAIISLEKRLWI